MEQNRTPPFPDSGTQIFLWYDTELATWKTYRWEVNFYRVFHAPDPLGRARGGGQKFRDPTSYAYILFDLDKCWLAFLFIIVCHSCFSQFQCFPLWCCAPAFAREQTQSWGAPLKLFSCDLCLNLCSVNFKSVLAPMHRTEVLHTLNCSI